MRLLSWLLAAIAGAILLAFATIDSWLTIGERAQGGYGSVPGHEKAAAEERARKASEAAKDAVGAVEALEKENETARP